MNDSDLLVDAFGRIRGAFHGAVQGLTTDQLAYRPDSDANSIAWLAWHLSRVQDDHVSGVAGTEQLWTSAGWAARFSLPFDPAEIGYGQSPDEVGSVRVEADLLLAYYDAVHERTIAYVRQLGKNDLDRIVDTSWDPPVSLGQRLVSVIEDDLQHVGQAAYVRGVVERMSSNP
jgi:uncharacterized damage-inducible protein DinB